VHGDKDLYFPVDHAQRLYDAAREPKELWLVPGLGHAESGCRPALVDRIGRWVATAAGATVAQDLAGVAAQVPPAPAADVPPEADGQSAAALQAAEATEAAGAAAAAGIGPTEGCPGS
jgi:hypothetical protein